MTNGEILKKAIEKCGIEIRYFFNDKELADPKYLSRHSYCLIFSHHFAKAFFGSHEHNWNFQQPTCPHCHKEGTADVNGDKYCWQTSLKEMVLEEYPLKYIERFL